MNPTADPYALNRVMELDHVIRVDVHGNVIDADHNRREEWAPELEVNVDAEPRVVGIPVGQVEGWTLLTGWTGQHGYNGAVMHSSEYVGGALAEHVLSTPGLWVALAVEHEGELSGWALAHLPESPEGNTY